ncbi:hypothetical protein [Candidatus Uabimicrobium amorphum]|uniref:FtsH ternary system domain-containing protein n=1 Tax=Uabimicrobium amorphum TaxID=2596890 RepID=A0A5S9IPP6_UABAM|nr:hypothetical protein [Candidatus Uabimicrobium amorphum]BBM85769.1 hypothetical protein UABAM_04147 [Candidatus Uabimicrobium amorphum]
MSRAYRIKVAGMHMNLHEDQNVILDIDLLPILDKESMQEILTNELKKVGGNEVDGKIHIEPKKNVVYKIDPQEQKLEIDVTNLKKDLDIYVEEESLSRKIKTLAKGGCIEIDADSDMMEELTERIGGRLEQAEKEILQVVVEESLAARQVLNKVLKEVYKEAVKKKANSMGNVTSIQECDEDGEYRVRVEIQ